MAKRVYLISCSGRPNYGDELITASWLNFLYRYFPEYEVWLDCPDPGNAFALFSSYHPTFRPINTVWKLCWRFSEDRENILTKVAHAINNFGTPDIDSNIAILHGADIVHVLGGGYINANWQENYAILAACSEVKKNAGCRIVATGLGLTPHTCSLLHDEYAALIASFDDVSVRDAASAAAFDLTDRRDDAFLGMALDLFQLQQQDRPSVDILCCIQNELADDIHFSAFVDKVGTYLQHHQGKTMGYCEAIPGADRTAYELLKTRVPTLQFYPFSQTWTSGLPLHAGSIMISTRFHHHLIAAALGVPGIALVIDQGYYNNKHNSLTDLGTGWSILTANGPHDGLAPSLNPQFPHLAKEFALQKLSCAQSIYS